ncbi:precorrin-2 C(20)-methyltransferase [Methanobrevibacter sp. 87.7]|uniref:precorrin-2 C(20)-methyltransferase n=1 Tax=Methanobrevibacter sp. 87.7 TaxID=387957 RepID=UPI000B512AB0|nr:precorrin-2 C(20)-methyltransferase [Methanobrevibacter sp. 87.7]OWT33263.1 precorrin-2 C(20)-methyltransferase [Methanobrevibacter sp. 87.7]
MVKKGKLFGIGVGPGDTELITLKAAKIIDKIPIIFAPRSSPNKHSIALSIVEPLIEKRENKKLMIVEPVFPMKEDVESLKRNWKQASLLLAEYLNSGHDVAFVTLGDPSIFSTFTYVQKNLEDEYEIEIIPGITSFTACAASIGKPLVEKNQILTVIPKIDERLNDLIDKGDTFVIMKTSRNNEEVEKIINDDPREKDITSVENCTRENEKILKGFSKDKPYLTTTIVKFNNDN